MRRTHAAAGAETVTETDPAQAWFDAWRSAWDPEGKITASAEIGRRLLEIGQDYAGIARDSWRFFGGATAAGAPPAAGSMQAAFAESYLRLLAPAAPFDLAGAGIAPGLPAAGARCQRALQALAMQAATIATDAARRLAAALSRDDPAALPVTSLRELHNLWVDCGEEAWAAAVHQDAYAAAQAEWLAALVEFVHEERRLHEAAQNADGLRP
ncbi:MAG: poly(R)-hydroxyalkanoic acid synthase subunit PhaE [Gammaproteobacteria bacterium]